MAKLCYLPATSLLYIYPFTPQITGPNFNAVCFNYIDIKEDMIEHKSTRSLNLNNSCIENKLSISA